jgi:hypothetical protein
MTRRPLVEILDDVAAQLRRYVLLPTDHDYVIVTLFVAHTYVVNAGTTTPRLSVLSPEKRCGKSRLLEVLNLLCYRSRFAASLSAAALYRMVGKSQDPVTLLIDEADSVFGIKPTESAEALRGALNAGWRKGAAVYRIDMRAGGRLEEWAVFAPAVIAGIGRLPDTITDRGPVIQMRRRKSGETVQPFRARDECESPLKALADELKAWAQDAEKDVGNRTPALPDGVEDRVADWAEPLLVIAELAGDHWAGAAGHAVKAKAQGVDDPDTSDALELLRDCRVIWDREEETRTQILTPSLCEQLVNLPATPWREDNLTVWRLARLLRPYGIRSARRRYTGDGLISEVRQTYLRREFEDAFARYLPPREEDAEDATEVVR